MAMDKQTEPTDDDDWDDEALAMDDEMDMVLAANELDDDEDGLLKAVGGGRPPTWQRIEQIQELRRLRMDLEDFDQYEI